MGRIIAVGNLKGRHGGFFVTGYHEYYSGAIEWIDEMARLGSRPLVNAHHVVDHDLTPERLAGGRGSHDRVREVR